MDENTVSLMDLSDWLRMVVQSEQAWLLGVSRFISLNCSLAYPGVKVLTVL